MVWPFLTASDTDLRIPMNECPSDVISSMAIVSGIGSLLSEMAFSGQILVFLVFGVNTLACAIMNLALSDFPPVSTVETGNKSGKASLMATDRPGSIISDSCLQTIVLET